MKPEEQTKNKKMKTIFSRRVRGARRVEIPQISNQADAGFVFRPIFGFSLWTLRALAKRAREESLCLSQSPQGSQRRLEKENPARLGSCILRILCFPCALCGL
jgi:hypothetical protein